MTDFPDRAALVDRRKNLARARDRALQNLAIMEGYVNSGRRSETDLATAIAEAEAACRAVIALDTQHPGIRTSGDEQDDFQVRQFMSRITGR
jgi:hypothetical protein